MIGIGGIDGLGDGLRFNSDERQDAKELKLNLNSHLMYGSVNQISNRLPV